jgi:hypothetical protein
LKLFFASAGLSGLKPFQEGLALPSRHKCRGYGMPGLCYSCFFCPDSYRHLFMVQPQKEDSFWKYAAL